MSDIREILLNELRMEVRKADEEIKKLKNDIDIEMSVKATVKGGMLATAARNACDMRAFEARKNLI